MGVALGKILRFQRRFLEFVEQRAQHILYLSVAIYTLVFSYFTISKHFAFETYAGDLGIFEQSLWSTLKYGLFFYNTPELGVHFRIHFDPILYLILPVYSAYPSPLTLLVLQSFFLSLGAIPIFWLARDELASKKAGLVFAILYLLYPPLQGVNWYDFHPESLVPLFLIAAFYYLKREKITIYFILIILAMMCKEIVALIIVFIGIYGIWINRNKILQISVLSLKGLLTDKSIVASLLTIAAGTVWYIQAGRIISSLSASSYNPFKTWFYLGGSITDILISVLTRPLYILQLAFTPFYSKVFYLVVLLGPLAFLSLLNPPSLLISLPWLAPSLLSLNPNHYLPVGTQYPALLIPFIFVSAVYGAKTLTQWLGKLATNMLSKNSKAAKIVKKKYVRNKLLYIANRPLAATITLLLICSITFFLSCSPLGGPPQVTFHDQVLEMVIYTIPLYSTVATQNEIFPHMSHNLNAYPVYHPIFEYDYILVDKTSITYYLPPIFGQYGSPIPPVAFSLVVPELVKNGSYGILISINGIMLLKRGYTGTPLINF